MHHHQRFYGALLVGVIVGVVLSLTVPSLSLVVAGDSFFASYLASMAMFAARLTAADMRRHADFDDEGILIVVLITLTAISLSIASIFSILNQESPRDTLRLGFAIASVPLGWLTLHTVAAFRYAHLYYSQVPVEGAEPADAGGLAFPGTKTPGSWDFIYYSFVVGMTAQVSDVQVLSTAMRRITLAHALASFFFNTVILALAVNIAVAPRV